MRVKPPSVHVHRSPSGGDVVFGLRLSNLAAHALRVKNVSVVFLGGGAVLSRRSLDAFFSRSPFPREARIPEGGEEEWAGICVDRVPEGADMIETELDLVSRDGWRLTRRIESARVGLETPAEGRVLRLPFRGPWKVTQGHACGDSHRHGALGGEFAWDFVAVDRAGRASVPSPSPGRPNRDSLTFGREVASPLDGRVAKVRDGVPDNEGLDDFPRKSLLEVLRTPDWVFGNYVVVDAGGGIWALLGHLQKDSIRVKPGDAVRAGDPLARAGNSGNSVRPHLHLQVMDRADPADPQVRGVPADLADYLEITATAGGESREIAVRRKERGDPPRDAIVAPSESPGSEDR